MPMERGRVGVLLVLVSAILFGLMPIFARLAYPQGVGVDEMLFVRFLLGFLFIGAVLALTHRLSLPSVRQVLLLIGLGAVTYYIQSTLYFTSLLYSPVAIAVLVLYTYPVFVAVGAFALGWEKISRRLTGVFIIALVGLVLVANPFVSPIGLGVIFAFGSAIMYAIYILSGSRLLRSVRVEVAVFYIMGGASISFGLMAVLTGSIHLNWNFQGWFWVIDLALVSTAAATLLFFGIARIGPSTASLISLGEPVTAVFASVVLFGNTLSGSQWLGGILILAGTALTTLYVNPQPRT